MAETFDISSKGYPTKFTADTVQGSSERFELNFGGWIDENPITDLTWEVAGGRATITEEAIVDNLVSALITFNYEAHGALIKVTVETGEESFVGYIDVTIRTADYPDNHDYGFYHGDTPPLNSSYPNPYVTFEGIEELTNKTIVAADNRLNINGLITAGTNINIPGIGTLENPLILNGPETTNDIDPVADRNYVTDAQLNTINNVGNLYTFSTISVAGQSDIVADQLDDTLTLVAGTGITLTTNAGSDSITITGTAAIADGDKGDITVSSSGATWTIEDQAVTAAKIADNTITATQLANNINISEFVNDAGYLSSVTGDWTGTFDGQQGTYYLDRANHTGTQLASTISDFNEAAQDAIGGILTDSSTIDFTYNDGSNTISAAFINAAGYTTNTGTVTAIGVATANGVSGSSSGGATPNLTISLGAITPSSVAASSTVTGSNLSGTNTGDQTIILTSDVTGSGTGSFATTIANNAVTLAKMADVATGTVFYRKTASTGDPEVQTLATLKTDLGLTGTNSGDQTITLTSDVTGSGTGSFATTIANSAVTLAKMANVATGTVFYRKTASTGAPEVQTLATLKTDLGLTGTNSGDQTITLTSDVTGSGSGSFSTTIANDVVTNAKLANMATQTFKGRTTAGTGDPEDLTATQATAMLDVFGASLKGLVPAAAASPSSTKYLSEDGTFSIPAGGGGGGLVDADYGDITVSGSGTVMTIDNGVVSLAKMADMATASVIYRKTAGTGAPEVNTVATLKTDLGLTGTNSGDQTITLTSDVTGSGTGSFAATIANDAVTLAKMANVATGTVFYRKTAGTGDPEVQTLATLKTDLGLTGTNSGDQTTVTGNAGTATALQTPRTIGGVSFDGTANIVPQTIQIIDAAADTTTFPMLAGSATGSLQPLTDPGLSYNASTNALTAATFIGALTGNATTATTATTATNGTVANEATDTTCFPLFVTAATGGLPFKSNAGLTFNSNTGALGATSFSGAGTGLTGTAASLTAGTVTTNANLTGAVTSTGNATSLGTFTAAQLATASSSKPIIQQVRTQTGTLATGTTPMPGDNTIPQNTEGDQYMSASITPTNTSNILVIDVFFNGSGSAPSLLSVALFQDSTANALAAQGQTNDNNNFSQSISFRYYMAAGTTSATTFKVRAGISGVGTTTFNGGSGAQLFGGVMASSLVITEMVA